MNFVPIERTTSHALINKENQSVRDFILALQTQASKCGSGSQLDDQFRSVPVGQASETERKLHKDSHVQAVVEQIPSNHKNQMFFTEQDGNNSASVFRVNNRTRDPPDHVNKKNVSPVLRLVACIVFDVYVRCAE